MLAGGLWVLLELCVVIAALLIMCPNRISHLLGLVAILGTAVFARTQDESDEAPEPRLIVEPAELELELPGKLDFTVWFLRQGEVMGRVASKPTAKRKVDGLQARAVEVPAKPQRQGYDALRIVGPWNTEQQFQLGGVRLSDEGGAPEAGSD